ncbi:lysophospholipase [Trametopsis cervina]|nr:lysophospholipase [Trametopsis cervina]
MATFRSLLLLLTLLSSTTFSAAAQQLAAQAYTPVPVACPSTPLVRSASILGCAPTLNSQEAAYINTRKQQVLPHAWKSYLATVQANANANRIQVPAYVASILGSSSVPDGLSLGIAASGGSVRATIVGAGVLNALDGRNTTSVRAGLGGLLQSASYLSGLSGGSWLVLSWVQANAPLLPALIFGLGSTNTSGASNVFGGWLNSIDLVQVSADPNTENEFITGLFGDIAGKFLAGAPVTVTDVWGRALARHYVNGTTPANFLNFNVTHGSGLLLSDVPKLPSFAAHSLPFPIVTSNTISVHQNNATIVPLGEGVPLTNPVYEMTPFEFGSFDPMLGSFIPMHLLGSHNGTCLTNYDQLSFIEGLSSNLFNAPGDSGPVGPIAAALNATFPQPGLNILEGSLPNPFLGVAKNTFLDTNEPRLRLVDGGENGDEIPLQPLLTKARDADVIIAIDVSSDTPDNFADGSSLIASQDRALLFPGVYSLPRVPTNQSTFVGSHLVDRPTFFGCSSAPGSSAPLVIYLANGGAPLGQAPVTNVSTFSTMLPDAQVRAVFEQSFDIATQGRPAPGAPTVKDPLWPVCVACAVVERARARKGVPRSGVCVSCLERYCWD